MKLGPMASIDASSLTLSQILYQVLSWFSQIIYGFSSFSLHFHYFSILDIFFCIFSVFCADYNMNISRGLFWSWKMPWNPIYISRPFSLLFFLWYRKDKITFFSSLEFSCKSWVSLVSQIFFPLPLLSYISLLLCFFFILHHSSPSFLCWNPNPWH